MANSTGKREYFGNVRKLPSGRFQARWNSGGKSHSARTDDHPSRPLTFDTAPKARRWLREHAEGIKAGTWPPPPPPSVVLFGDYAANWVRHRRVRDRLLSERTREHYIQLLDAHICPTFGDVPLQEITPAAVQAWHESMEGKKRPTARAHAYGLMKAIMATAVSVDLITANPCRVRGGGLAETAKKVQPATPEELDALTEKMPERLRMLVQLACWCSLRFGEVTALRRGDVDLGAKVLRIERAVVRTKAGTIEHDPKSRAGKRTVSIPPHLLDGLAAHLETYVDRQADALIFPAAGGGFLAPSALYRSFYPAREAIGRPDLRFHDLRHTGQTWAALSGASVVELMARAGQSSVKAAQRYWHVMNERPAELAANMSRRELERQQRLAEQTTA